jgi:hypothetical protein
MVDERQTITLIIQQSEYQALPWLRFLLGDHAGDIIEDPESTLVLPSSLIVCERPDRLPRETLERTRRAATVGLVHLGDARYRTRLQAYRAFAVVWRTYYHSALTGLGVRQLPLGPVAVTQVTHEPRPEARKPPHERAHTWSVTGPLTSRDSAVVEALSPVGGGAAGRDPDTSVIDVLGESTFVPCAADGVHLESHRIYDALEMGAIPIVERRRHFDYFRLLLGDHPLPSVRSWDQARDLVAELLDDRRALAALQSQVVEWWTTTKHSLARAVRRDAVAELIDGGAPVRPGSAGGDGGFGSGPLDAMPPRWRGRVEMWRHRGLPRLRS